MLLASLLLHAGWYLGNATRSTPIPSTVLLYGLRLLARSESGRHEIAARRGQARHLRPAVRCRVVHLRRADETLTGVVLPVEDVELAAHRCGGMTPPSDAHASQLRPFVGQWVIRVLGAQRARTHRDENNQLL